MRIPMCTPLAVAALVLSLGCADQRVPTGPADPPLASISDGAHRGRPGFYFLPPLAPEPETDGVFDPLREPLVSICRLDGAVCDSLLAEYTKESGPDSVRVEVDPVAEAYGVDWPADRFQLEDSASYRIRVLLEGRLIGYVDVRRSGGDLLSTESGEPVPLADGSTLPIRFRIEAGLRLGALVPLQPPDTLPQGLYNDANLTRSSPCFGGPYLANIVILTFRSDATQLQRQQAVDTVRGEVIGGRRWKSGEGYYYVQLPSDSTGQNVCNAVEVLNSFEFVSTASHEFFLHVFYRRPNEEGAWADSHWQVDLDNISFSERWGHERIGAPLTWGCSTGAASTPIAVVSGPMIFESIPWEARLSVKFLLLG